ncbi:MAG: hypothetical protein ACI8O8_002901, partial [Oleiphilaceae bacterium]
MWVFNKKLKSYGRKEDATGKLFDDLGDVEALIREAFQNAIDAKKSKSDGPVTVKLSLVKTSLGAESWLIGSNTGDFNGHASQIRNDYNKELPLDIAGEFLSLAVEDFNTRGLCGDFDNDENHPNKGTLVKYWWESNISDKERSAGGSHGLGKETYSLASQSRAIFALSKRDDDNDEILIGFARPGRHHLDGIEYLDEVRFGVEVETEEENEIHPISRLQENFDDVVVKLTKFKEKFKLKREPDETGTSFVITNIEEAHFTKEKIIETICDNFYLPISLGVIKVDIYDLNEERTCIDEVSIDQIVRESSKEDWKTSALKKNELAKEIGNTSQIIYQSHNHDFSKNNKTLTEEAFLKDDLVKLRERYLNHDVIRVRFFIPIKAISNDYEKGCIDIVIQRNQKNGDEGVAGVFRGNINIQKVGFSLAKSNCNILVDIPPFFIIAGNKTINPLSNFLRFCEDPGHLKWNRSPNRRGENWLYGETWQRDFVVGLPKKMLSILENEKNKKLENFANEIFSIEIKDPYGGQLGLTDEDDETPVPPPLPPKLSAFSIDQLSEGVGFMLKAQSTLKEYFETLSGEDLVIKVRVGYALYAKSKSRALKLSAFEIDLKTNFDLMVRGAKLMSVNMNELMIKLEGPDFSVSAKGFDLNRDLIVDVNDVNIIEQ